jgi:hypothetical protein
MKIGVINFSGNTGKSTLATHLLKPRIEGAWSFAIESLNSGADRQAILYRGTQYDTSAAPLSKRPPPVVFTREIRWPHPGNRVVPNSENRVVPSRGNQGLPIRGNFAISVPPISILGL